jgi:hypothetical protein
MISLVSCALLAAAQSNIPVLVIGGITAPKPYYNFIAKRLRVDGFTVATMALPGFPIPGCADTNTTLGEHMAFAGLVEFGRIIGVLICLKF